MSQLSMWRQLTHAAMLLKSGQPVAIPTETVYGLAAPIRNARAIEKIFLLKERPFFDPLIVHVRKLSEVRTVAREFSGAAEQLGRVLWPGPLTLVLPRNLDLNPMICAGLDTVGVRIPNHPVARRLIERVGQPLAAPSANKFGKTSPTTPAHVRGDWPGDELFVVEGAQSAVGIESTVVQVKEDEHQITIEILRPGFYGEAELRNALGGLGKRIEVVRVESKLSPGHTPEHYQPKLPLVVVPPGAYPLSGESLKKIQLELNLTGTDSAELKLNPNPAIAARELYASLHDLSTGSADFLFVVESPELSSGLWGAIWDRLGRAAKFRL